MAAVEERLARLEAEYESLKPSLHQRLERLEKVFEKPPRKGFARLIAWMGPALPQLIGSAVILVLAFWVKDSVDLAIKQQQLHLSFVAEMKEQLEAMAKEDATLAEIERAAVLVAVFGQPAIMPLMNELRYGGNRAIGAETGLRSLAFMNQDAVCELMSTEFQEMANDLAMHVAAAQPQWISAEEVPADIVEKEKDLIAAAARNEGKPDNIIEKIVEGRIKSFYQDNVLMEQGFVRSEKFEGTVGAMVKQMAAKMGENISINKFSRLAVGEGSDDS